MFKKWREKKLRRKKKRIEGYIKVFRTMMEFTTPSCRQKYEMNIIELNSELREVEEKLNKN
jgi:hypothetical protein